MMMNEGKQKIEVTEDGGFIEVDFLKGELEITISTKDESKQMSLFMSHAKANELIKKIEHKINPTHR